MSTSAQRRAARNARRLKTLKRDDKMAYEREKRDIRIRDTNELNHHKDAVAAHAIQVGSQEAVAGVYEKARGEVARDAETIEKSAASIEKNILTEPRTIMTGAAHEVAEPIPVGHWRAQMPHELAARLGLERMASSAYVLIAQLPHGGGRVDFVGDLLVADQPTLVADPEFYDWAMAVARLFTTDINPVLALLGHLRDVEWWAETCEAAGVNIKTTEQVQRRGKFCGAVNQPVTTVNVPSLARVQVTDEGLELVFEPRPGDTPERWSKALPVLRNTFKGLGADADALSVRESRKGEIVLGFNNAKSSFPKAVAPEPPARPVADRADAIARYHDAAWVLGVDAREHILAYPMNPTTPHVLVVAGTGGGKSVWARTTIEGLRARLGFTCFIASGKASDFAALEGQPGIAMVAADPAQTAVMVRRVALEVRSRAAKAAAAKKPGASDAERAAAFDFPPLLMLLDEWGATAMTMEKDYGKSAKAFFDDVDYILRVGREMRVHVVLLSQTIRKTGPGAVPGSWQENLALTVSLGAPSEITLQSDAFTEESRSRAAQIGSRLKGKAGRGLIAERESGRVIEFQSFYGWSPGTTSLAPDADPKVAPPTAEVRDAWERWVPISSSVPWILPRVGIKADGPDWAASNDLAEVAATPTVALTDAAGDVVPGREQYDPASPSWLGRADQSAVLDGHDELEFATAEEASEPEAADAGTAPHTAEQSKPIKPAPKPRTTRTPKPPKATKPAADDTMEFA